MPVGQLAKLLPDEEDTLCSMSDDSDCEQIDLTHSPSGTHNLSDSSVQTIYHAACIIHEQLNSVQSSITWLLESSSLRCSNAKILPLLYHFLAWSVFKVSDDAPICEKRVVLPPTSDRRIKAIAYDMLCTASAGRVKSTKHVAPCQ